MYVCVCLFVSIACFSVVCWQDELVRWFLHLIAHLCLCLCLCLSLSLTLSHTHSLSLFSPVECLLCVLCFSLFRNVDTPTRSDTLQGWKPEVDSGTDLDVDPALSDPETEAGGERCRFQEESFGRYILRFADVPCCRRDTRSCNPETPPHSRSIR
jgi:hypothetical protein